VTLHDFVNAAADAEMVSVYEKVVDALIDYQLRVSEALPTCGFAVRAFDRSYLRWETSYFCERFLRELVGVSEDSVDVLTAEFNALADAAIAMPQLFLHRDFQSQNVMLQDGVVRFVDFQGGRTGPYVYDLASLTLDPYVFVTEDLRVNLLRRYYRAMTAAGVVSVDFEVFVGQFQVAAAQRLMQVLGAYSFLSKVKGKTDYLRYVSPALSSLRQLLEDMDELPRLRTLLKSIRRVDIFAE